MAMAILSRGSFGLQCLVRGKAQWLNHAYIKWSLSVYNVLDKFWEKWFLVSSSSFINESENSYGGEIICLPQPPKCCWRSHLRSDEKAGGLTGLYGSGKINQCLYNTSL